jgi:phosphoribosylglycinamide formyltransferase-1
MAQVVLFAYNFPHKKTQDFLFHLIAGGHEIEAVLAADPIELKIPPSSIRTKIRHIGLIHPSEIARRIGVPYHVVPHKGPEIEALLERLQPSIGVIAGARILPSAVIGKFTRGIINFHPGLIPEARGLDAMLWSIYRDLPLGVTAHSIDRHVDAGTVLLRKEIPIWPDDELLDTSERLYETQLELLGPAIQALQSGTGTPVDPNTPHNTKMPPELEREVVEMFPSYRERHAKAAVRI